VFELFIGHCWHILFHDFIRRDLTLLILSINNTDRGGGGMEEEEEGVSKGGSR